jgi:hypothetical protein
MSIRNVVLFTPGGQATPTLFLQWRMREPAKYIRPAAILVDGGMATRYFRELWRLAFPDRRDMPLEPVANKDGTGTERFWDVFA